MMHVEDKGAHRRLDDIINVLNEVLWINNQIYSLLNKPNKMFIEWHHPHHHHNRQNIGELKVMTSNDVQLNLKAPFGTNEGVPVELNADGSNFIFDPANIAWAAQDSTIASFVQNTDGSADFTPLLAGSTGVAVSDRVTGLSTQGTLTVVGAITTGPVSMSIAWQNPTH